MSVIVRALHRRETQRIAMGALAVLCLSLPACSDNAQSRHPVTTSERLNYIVTLPKKLGNATLVTHHPVTTTPMTVYPMGLTLDGPSNGGVKSQGKKPGLKTQDFGDFADTPQEADLSQWAVTPGNQGHYGSCASWSTSYTNMGWFLNKQGMGDGNPLNPVFVYGLVLEARGAQCGPNSGSMISDPLKVLVDTGVPSAAQFSSTTCVSATDEDRQAAGAHRITSYTELDLSQGVRQAMTTAIAGGKPVSFGIMLYNEFMNANAQDYLIQAPDGSSNALGGHGITALRYDSQGVWIENSWGEKWGKDGWAELSWDYVEGQCSARGQTQPCVMEADTIDDVVTQ
jgi:hypothetical protein